MELSASKNKKVRRLLKESAFLNFSTFIYIALKFISGFLVARFLGPTLYGLRTIFGLVTEYEYFTQLGTFDAMRREVPYNRGKGDIDHAKFIEMNVFGINMLYSFVLFFCMIGLAFYLYSIDTKQIYIDFVLFVGLYSICEKIYCYYLVQLTVDRKVNLLSTVKILQGFIYVIACVFFTYFWSLRGLLIGILVTDIFINLFIAIRANKVPRFRIHLKTILGLVKIGFPIMLIPLVFILLRSIDRIIIAKLLTQEMLGYFAVGTILSGLVFTPISDLVNVIFAPRIMEKLGKTGDIFQVKAYFVEPTVLIAYCTPFLIGTLFLGIHIPIRYFLPKYLPAIPVAQILILGAFFNAVMMIPSMVCIAANKQVQVVWLMVIAVVINAIFSWVFILSGLGIGGVAIGSAISYFALSLMIIQYTMNQFNFVLKEIVQFLILIYSPFCYTTVLVLLSTRFFNIGKTDFFSDVLQTVLTIVFFLLMFSLIFLFVRKQRVFQSLFHIIKNPRHQIETIQ